MEVLDITNKFPQSLGTSLNGGSIVYYFRTLLLGFTVEMQIFRDSICLTIPRGGLSVKKIKPNAKNTTRAQFNKTFTIVIHKCRYCFRVRKNNGRACKLHL